MNSDKKIFITGGLGFIGSNLTKALIDKGYKITIFDNFSSGSIGKLVRLGIDPKSKKISIIKGNILDLKSLTQQMKGADLVIHHAAQLEITKAVSDPYYDLNSNTIGTLNLLEAMKKNGINTLLNASSACVYGQKNKSQIPTKENDLTNPNWAYGVSKLAAEKYCSIYSEVYKFKIISTRYAIIYGQNEWFGRVMTLFIHQMLNQEPLILFGQGDQLRDFTHVNDVVDFDLKAIEYLMKKKTNFHEVFNVSTATGTTIKELAHLIKRISEKIYPVKISIIVDRKVKEGQKSQLINRVRLPSELQNMVLNNSKAKRLLSWKPKIGLDKGVKEQIQWAKSNLDLWQKMSY